MKQITIISFILIILLQFTSCKRAPLSTGEMTTEVRQLEHFSKLKLFNNVNVTIMPCDTFMIEISAGKNLIKNITSEVNNDTLIIKNNNLCNWLRDYDSPVNATIYLKKLYYIHYESVGDLKCNKPLIDCNNNFYLFVDEGSGNIDLELYYKDVTLFFDDGSCVINIDGYADNAYITNKTFGILDAGDLQARYVNVLSNSPNETYIHCINTLTAQIMSIGNIYYRGTPDSISVNKSFNAKGELIPY